MSLDGWVGDVTYVTVACKGPKRFFDLDAVRTEYAMEHDRRAAEAGVPGPVWSGNNNPAAGNNRHNGLEQRRMTHAGAPPLDWHTDMHPEDGDWLWKLPTQPYKGSHYATYPLELPTRLIMAMCPLRVCTECGKPSERITEAFTLDSYRDSDRPQTIKAVALADEHGLTDEHIAAIRAFGTSDAGKATTLNNGAGKNTDEVKRLAGEAKAVLGGYFREFVQTTTATRSSGWSDCGHNDIRGVNAWRTGVVLDPFAGSGTTLEAAQNVGRHAIGIDLDETNADLARSRVGMYMTVDDGEVDA